jgi:methylaspartate mutase sigma subunit
MEVVSFEDTERGRAAVATPGTGGPASAADGERRLRLLLCSVASDSHMWNLVALQLELEGMGHEVLNLGSCTPVELVLEACLAQRPDCVVVSTVNGHGHVDGAQLIVALRSDPRLAGLPVVIGGKLGVHGAADTDLAGELLRVGYDAVFPVGADDARRTIAEFHSFLALKAGRGRR